MAAYRTVRASTVFTTQRLIVRDAQGMSGRQVDVRRLDMLITHSVLRGTGTDPTAAHPGLVYRELAGGDRT